jgi:hypothetical protein
MLCATKWQPTCHHFLRMSSEGWYVRKLRKAKPTTIWLTEADREVIQKIEDILGPEQLSPLVRRALRIMLKVLTKAFDK